MDEAESTDDRITRLEAIVAGLRTDLNNAKSQGYRLPFWFGFLAGIVFLTLLSR